MKQINVDIHYEDYTDEPTFIVAENGSMKWKYADVEKIDWKESTTKVLDKLSKRDPSSEIVAFFDGSDTLFYGLLSEAILLR